jgi:hypothetical protein
MYIGGVSTRRVSKIIESMCGTGVSSKWRRTLFKVFYFLFFGFLQAKNQKTLNRLN